MVGEKSMIELVATCLFGLEKQLGEEIDALGCKRLDTMDGRVTFLGSEADIARANIRLRCAERIYIRVGSFPATTFTELFDGVRALPFEDFIGPDDAFPVKGHAIRSKLYSVPDCQSIVKKAVVERLNASYGLKWFPEEGAKYQIEFFIFKDIATLMIDTSGVALHKRGYRPAAGAAPLRETLAAALALTSRPREDILFWDPFCGSGTIVIEAAMILKNIAPGLDRRFAAMDFDCLHHGIWKDAADEARDLIHRDAVPELFGSDLDEKVLQYARENAERAGVNDCIRFFRADARRIEKPSADRRGTVVCNPPYGERLMELREVEALYRDIGRQFEKLAPWQIYVLTSHQRFEALYGSRADKIRKLFNGMIPCNLYQYFRPKN
jgi:putative N6-adenine-specific DNA methylase